MVSDLLISYAASFVSFVMDSDVSDRIDSIILFGSVAREEHDDQSDVDIFIDTRSDIRKVLLNLLDLFNDSEEGKKWRTRGVSNEISIKTGRIDEWPLRRDVISNGIVLYGRYVGVPKELEYYLLVRIRTGDMERKDKIKVWRRLYGYVQKVGNKEYVSDGLIEDLGGKRLGREVFVIPSSKKNDIIRFLKDRGIDYKINEIWSDSL